LTDLLKKIAFG